jgi:transcriptional regulator with GAF, ATPase, and Fis domain
VALRSVFNSLGAPRLAWSVIVMMRESHWRLRRPCLSCSHAEVGGIPARSKGMNMSVQNGRVSLPMQVQDYERRLIVEALVESKGHQRRAARALGVLPTTLSMKMKRLGLRGEPEGPAAAERL